MKRASRTSSLSHSKLHGTRRSMRESFLTLMQSARRSDILTRRNYNRPAIGSNGKLQPVVSQLNCVVPVSPLLKVFLRQLMPIHCCVRFGSNDKVHNIPDEKV